ncbi:MAG: YggS family pyridoxal phosphate-dependent enzyme [Oscillospiraceae bacterium]|nr:YggS family pyridoxal phosphate-dependent enzyme [Oscillospiraceae bacterium]
MSIGDNVRAVRENIARAAEKAGRDPSEILLVAATKMNGAERVREAVAAGVDACGENRVQELVEKNALGAYAGAPLHFIGHLQKNKVNKLVGVCDLIQSVDSPELIAAIGRRAVLLGVTQNILLEVNIAGEAQKSGVAPEGIWQLLDLAAETAGISVQGLMTVPPICEKTEEIRGFFDRMYRLYVDIRAKKRDNVTMRFLSMGMSADYVEAIAAGANMVRVGSAIFGERDYNR